MIWPQLYEKHPEMAPIFATFSNDAAQTLAKAEKIAVDLAHQAVTPEHLLLALLTFKAKGFVLSEVISVIPDKKLKELIELVQHRLDGMPSDDEMPSRYSSELISVIQRAREVAELELLHYNLTRAAAFYGALLEMQDLSVHAIFDQVGVTADQFYAEYIPRFG